MTLLSAPRKDDRERKRSRDNRGMMGPEDSSSWTTVGARERRGQHFDPTRFRNNTFTRVGFAIVKCSEVLLQTGCDGIDWDLRIIILSFKLQNVDTDMQFRAGFSSWGRGSSGGVRDQQQQEEESRPNNRFAVLDQAPPERRTSQM